MVTEQLIIDGVTIPIDKGISTVLTFSIKDIQQPDKVKSSFSKTIKLPGSKAINDKLNFVFEVNSDSTFNPNLKLDAVYYQNDIAVFSGFIQLKYIHKKDYNQVEYSVVLFGETANIFRKLGNKFLNDVGMNWSDLDHDYTQFSQSASWTPTINSKYTYPMINYGNDTDISVYNVNEMFPAVYVKEYIDRMFADAGYTYTSNFFTTTTFRRLIIPFNGKEFKPTQTDLSPRRVQANTPLFVSSGVDNYNLDSSLGGQVFFNSNDIWQMNDLRFSNETLDANNQYNPTTGVLTVGASGFYRVSVDVTVQMETTPKAGAALPNNIVSDRDPIFVNLLNIKANGAIQNGLSTTTTAPPPLSPAVTYQTANPTTYPDNDFKQAVASTIARNYNPPNRYQLSVDVQLQAGDLITVDLWTAWYAQAGGNYASTPYYDIVSGDRYDADFKVILTDANFSFNILDSPYSEGDTIDMFTAIPEKIKQRDFLTSIIKMFNLYMIPDENNPKNMIIETREDFYTSDIVDWSSKLDYSKEHNLTPTAVTNKQKYIYTYKKDADYYNKKYESSWLDIYGTRNVYLDNDFNKSDHKTELIFSPTPLVGQLTNDRVISTIIDVDETLQQKTFKSNIRILYYGGKKLSIINWTHQAISGDVIQSRYPYAGHFDDPYNPTLDINFGLPREIYYDNTWSSITVTNANLYETYHRKELEQITNKDSKIFKGYFLLNPVDIANLSFRSTYWFENSYWTLNKVVYGSSVYQPSKCEFLKLKNVPTPVASTGELLAGKGFIGDEDLPFMYKDTLSGGNVLSTKSNNVDGLNNFIDRTAMFVDIKGDSNKVFTGSKNINIQGDNNVIESNLENITLINTSNVTITESNTTYINGQKKGGDGILLVSSGTYSQDLSIVGYEADCTSGTVTINLLEGLYEGYEQTFKKIAGDNDLVIDASFISGQVESDSSIRITKINDSVTLYYNGVDYNIK
jgi:hypothetical protein